MLIPVTKSFLPPVEEVVSKLTRVLESGWLTNRGPVVTELEKLLADYLSVANVLAMANGTLPIQIALRIFARGGEVVTTPFSYVATTSAIVWESATPVFADIDPYNLTIDPTEIRKKITSKTQCILATHVYGNPCDTNSINEISEEFKIPVIYDGAHAFGVEYQGKSIFSYGDISTCSFHATKLFHTCEGGALITSDSEVFKRAFKYHNFGHNGPDQFDSVGINAKMSELHAAIGVCLIPYVEQIISTRKRLVDLYMESMSFERYKAVMFREGTKRNYAYLPVVFHDPADLNNAVARMNQSGVYPRRYFTPSLNKLPYLKYDHMPASEFASSRVLCLPLYSDLSYSDITFIVSLLDNRR